MRDSADAPTQAGIDTTQHGRVKKRTSNACRRCRQQKIKCSGTKPCGQCSKRSLSCVWDKLEPKVLVPKSFLNDLQHRAASTSQHPTALLPTPTTSILGGGEAVQGLPSFQHDARIDPPTGSDPTDETPYSNASRLGIELDADSDFQSGFESTDHDEPVTNPLFHGSSAYTLDTRGRPSYLGTSSNWAFARRILMMAHAKVAGGPLPSGNLLFEGATYQLGWDGLRTSDPTPSIALPTADFAMYLINTVKFRASQLFHLFDESTFMDTFNRHHSGSAQADVSWLTHYYLVLALGKAFVGRTGSMKRPPGAELFVQGMKMLPDVTFLCANALESMEILCCAALYLQCLDMRSAAYNLIGQALRLAFTEGLHTDMQSLDCNYDAPTIQRCRQIWWTIYILDCHMTTLMGLPCTIPEQSISTPLPDLGSQQKSQALKLHERLATAIALSIGTVYSKSMPSLILERVQTVLRDLADMSEERSNAFPLTLGDNTASISRLSAHLHLFHHQCIILTTRPLLFNFWQRRLSASRGIRISSRGGIRSFVRVCIGSAKQILKILTALQDQDLIETFMPFDLEAVWSAAVVLLLSKTIDPSLLKDVEVELKQVYAILSDMATRGNLIAEARSIELQQLEYTLARLDQRPETQGYSLQPPFMDAAQELEISKSHTSGESLLDADELQRWTTEGIGGEELEALANSLDFENFDWFMPEALDQS